MLDLALVRAVVTGGAGFVGSTTVDPLVRDGGQVLVLDELSSGRAENLQARPAEVDVRDAQAVEEEITGCAPELVCHFAGRIDVRTSMSDPAHDARTEVLGPLDVVTAERCGRWLRRTRDVVHVVDVATANVAAATMPGLPHDTYNIGTGVEVTVNHLVATLPQITGVATTPEHRDATYEWVRSVF